MSKALVPSCMVVILAFLMGGCAALFGETENEKKPAPRPTQTISYQLPKITNPDPAGQPDEREIDGIVISLIPRSFSAQRSSRTVLKELPTFVVMNDQYYYEKSEVPEVHITPPTVTLHAKITNRLDHVLRLGGAVFSAKVNGTRLPAISGAEELLGAVLAPGDSQDAELVVGRQEAIADGATIALDLFDVPTITDGAGNATKKTAFRWVFKFIREPREDQVRVTTSQVRMTRAEAAAYLDR